MILCLTIVGVAVLFIIGQFMSNLYSKNYYSKESIEKCKDIKERKSMRRSTRLHIIGNFCDNVFGEPDGDCARCWLAWIAALAFSIFTITNSCIVSSDITKKYAEYEYYQSALEQGYIWKTQSSVSSEQADMAKLKAWVHAHPIRRFYNTKDVDALYDKVMAFKIPAVEDTREYITATKRVINTKE